MRKILLIFLFLTTVISAQLLTLGQARGAFLSVEVGPRIPLGDLANYSSYGPGFNSTFSYTDNKLFPFFVYGTLGYAHFPGDQDLYKQTNYSSFSTNVISLSAGVRYYFKPLLENIVILTPVVDAGGSIGIFEKAHRYKIDSGLLNFTEDTFNVGAHVGAGFSMFILDVLGYYNYFHGNQFLSLNFRVTIPVYVIF
ncbi:MAG: hypothetical protein SCALA702_13250 [Melioribacteraceae bacterium]|nr:MAG: hypothetical protein SCALA702_13250 [Melioribacteraceae bacterium]